MGVFGGFVLPRTSMTSRHELETHLPAVVVVVVVEASF
jgi:hypothetical protein